MTAGLDLVASQPLHDALLGGALNQQIKSPNRVMSSADCYAAIGVGFPELVSI